MREDHLGDGREANIVQLAVREEGDLRDLGSVGPEFTTNDFAPEHGGQDPYLMTDPPCRPPLPRALATDLAQRPKNV
jgi:hypothetical protein